MPSFRRPQPSSPPPRPLFRPDGTPSYQQRLAVIGRHLDVRCCKTACVVEAEGNYIVRALSEGDRAPMLMEFVTEDFAGGGPDAPRKLMPSSLLPSGYEITFRAVGRLLDERSALMIAVIECPSALQILGYEGGHSGGHVTHMPFELTLDDWALRELVDGSV